MLALDSIERVVRYIERRRPVDVDVRYSLATNGTLLTPGTIAFLDRHGFDIELSFDGVPAAQAVRGAHSFARIETALDLLRDRAPSLFWRRLSVGVTLDADAVPHLSESFSYFLDKRLQAVSTCPAVGQSARWTPRVFARLERELNAIYLMSREHYRDTREVPLVAFRKTAASRPGLNGTICGAAGSSSVTVDVDGEVYACPMLAESSQRFANPALAATVQPMRMGRVTSRSFWRRVANLPERASQTGMFHVRPGRHSLHGARAGRRYRRECQACPLAALLDAISSSAQTPRRPAS